MILILEEGEELEQLPHRFAYHPSVIVAVDSKGLIRTLKNTRGTEADTQRQLDVKINKWLTLKELTEIILTL